MVEERIKEEEKEREIRNKSHRDEIRRLKKEHYNNELKEIERKCDLKRQIEEKKLLGSLNNKRIKKIISKYSN